MSEGYIGLAPSYGVFQKQVIAGTTATIVHTGYYRFNFTYDIKPTAQLNEI